MGLDNADLCLNACEHLCINAHQNISTMEHTREYQEYKMNWLTDISQALLLAITEWWAHKWIITVADTEAIFDPKA